MPRCEISQLLGQLSRPPRLYHVLLVIEGTDYAGQGLRAPGCQVSTGSAGFLVVGFGALGYPCILLHGFAHSSDFCHASEFTCILRVETKVEPKARLTLSVAWAPCRWVQTLKLLGFRLSHSLKAGKDSCTNYKLLPRQHQSRPTMRLTTSSDSRV